MVFSLIFMHTMNAKSPKSWPGKLNQNLIAAAAAVFLSTYTSEMASIITASRLSQKGGAIKDFILPQVIFFFLKYF